MIELTIIKGLRENGTRIREQKGFREQDIIEVSELEGSTSTCKITISRSPSLPYEFHKVQGSVGEIIDKINGNG